MKLRLDRKGLSPLVAVIVLLTLVMVLGAIIAGTLSGAPRPVLPATTAVNLMTPYGGNPGVGDQTLVIRHEYGAVIDDAWAASIQDGFWGVEMKLLVNGVEVHPDYISGSSNGAEVEAVDYLINEDVIQNFRDLGGEDVHDFAAGDQIELRLSTPLESSDLIQVFWDARDVMLVEYLVQ